MDEKLHTSLNIDYTIPTIDDNNMQQQDNSIEDEDEDEDMRVTTMIPIIPAYMMTARSTLFLSLISDRKN